MSFPLGQNRHGLAAPPTELTFTPGNALVTQTVTATGVDDQLVDGAVAYSVLTAVATSADPDYAGIDPPDVSLTNTDDDRNGCEIFSDGFESGDTGAWSKQVPPGAT